MKAPLIPVSVIICTYNPKAELFQKVLDHLEKQTLAKEEWELIIVDNNSEISVNQQFTVTWHPGVHFLNESTQGLIFARISGIAAAKGEWIVFVDDDNLLDSHYLENALSIAKKHPFLGVFGGSCEGQFEKKPAPYQTSVLEILAIREVHRDRWANFPYWPCMPLGAGMVIRKSAADQYVQQVRENTRLLALGRSGTSTMSGEDVDIVFSCLEQGWATGVFTALRLMHVIPANRLTDAYLLRLTTGITASSIWQTYVRQGASAIRYHYALRPLFTAVKRCISWRHGAWQALRFEIRRLIAIRSGYSIAKKMIRNDPST